jgi:hypothetical protein
VDDTRSFPRTAIAYGLIRLATRALT